MSPSCAPLVFALFVACVVASPPLTVTDEDILALKNVHMCGSTKTIKTAAGGVENPSPYGTYLYNNSQHCTWVFAPTSSTQLYLHLVANLEINFDFILLKNSTGGLVTSFTGIVNTHVVMNTPFILNFNSDASIVSSGFRLLYSSVPFNTPPKALPSGGGYSISQGYPCSVPNLSAFNTYFTTGHTTTTQTSAALPKAPTGCTATPTTHMATTTSTTGSSEKQSSHTTMGEHSSHSTNTNTNSKQVSLTTNSEGQRTGKSTATGNPESLTSAKDHHSSSSSQTQEPPHKKHVFLIVLCIVVPVLAISGAAAYYFVYVYKPSYQTLG